jgi:carbonic anhydrase
MNYSAAESVVVNNGDAIHVDAVGKFGSLFLPEGRYDLRQLSFHFPSQHKIDNKSLAGEIHLVHTGPYAPDHAPDDVAANDSFVIVSILLEEGPDNVFLEAIGASDEDGNTLPEFDQELSLGSNASSFGSNSLDVAEVFRDQLKGSWYSYSGSLTVAPCQEEAHWYVMQTTSTVSTEQVKIFMESVGNTSEAQTNARPVQPLNNRTVCFNKLVDDCLNVSRRTAQPKGGSKGGPKGVPSAGQDKNEMGQQKSKEELKEETKKGLKQPNKEDKGEAKEEKKDKSASKGGDKAASNTKSDAAPSTAGDEAASAPAESQPDETLERKEGHRKGHSKAKTFFSQW